MLIAGLQKLSLVDFPSRMSAVVFTQGCNFTCPYCQNPSLVGPLCSESVSENEVLEYLSKRKNIVTGLVLTGGEPLSQKDLPEFIEKVKMIGIKVKLDTNGSRPAMLEGLINGKMLDYIALDIKTSFGKYHLLTGSKAAAEEVRKSITLVMKSGVPYEFRTTVVPMIVDKDDLLAIAAEINGAEKWCLQQFRTDVTLDNKFSELKPYPKKVLQALRDSVAGFVKKVEIRGV